MKVSAIICSAGKGERAGFGINKLLAPLYGAPALYHTLKKFDVDEIDEVIVTSSEEDYPQISALCEPFGFKVTPGGRTRTDTVKNALSCVTGDIVLIHDGARPFLSHELILRCIEETVKFKSSVCAVKATDTAVYGNERADRNRLLLLQTPQAFYTQDIKRAYALAGGDVFTDDSAVYERYIQKPHYTEGEYENIKLTFKQDFSRGFPAMPRVQGKRIGFGVDTHAFGEGNSVTLAGVNIECDRALIAHSDGDVVLHAVMDALLSSAGLKDIGHYFPDGDESLRGADSKRLLRETVDIIGAKGFAPVNISITVQAEKPRLQPHIDKMIQNLEALTGVSAENIAVSAGTAEGLGFVGEGLGITAYCAVITEEKSNG